MNTRIRYRQSVDNQEVWVAEGFISTTLNTGVHVMLTPSQLSYMVVQDDGKLLSEGTGTNLADLKKKAKAALTNNGVSFLKEQRTRKKSSTEDVAA